jgi:hypothetical protein
MSSGDEGLVYEIHFDEPIGDPENVHGWAQHYIGHTTDLDRRMGEHRRGSDAAIMRAVGRAGIGWRVVRTWAGSRDAERQIKLLRSGRRLCPECTEHPLTGAGAIARAAALRAEREARARAPEPPRPAPVPPYEAGREMGRQFMAQQHAAGRSAAQIEATHDYITGPWHEMGHYTEDQAERFRGYTELVASALGLIREAEAEPAPHQEMEAETGPTRPAGNELEEQMQEYDTDGNPSADSDADAGQYEHDPGSWLARDGDGRVLEVDADGHPGREADPGDRRPVAEAESDTGQAYVDEAGLESAAYWGGEGPPAWEAQAEATTAEPAPGTGPHDVPWWDGERMASDRDRSPERVAEMEAEAG